MKNMRTLGVIAGLATAVALVLSGCAGSSGGSSDLSPKDDGAKLTLWMRAGKETIANSVVKAYNASHKNQVSVTFVPADQYLTKLSNSVASGSAPDLAVTDLIFMPQLVKGGVLQSLSAELDGVRGSDKLAPAHMNNATGADGKKYGIPFDVDASGFLYNKTLFEKAGLDPDSPPTTWDELIADSKAVAGLGGDTKGFWMGGNFPGGLSYNFTPFIWAQDSDIVAKDGSFDFTASGVTPALELARTLWNDGTMPESSKSDDGTGFFSAFQAGNIGIAATAITGADPYAGKDLPFEYGAFAVPGPNGGRATFTGGDVISIPQKAKHGAEAMDFITWLVADATQQKVYLGNSLLPLRSDVADQLPADASPYLELGASLVSVGKTFRSTDYNEVIASPTGPYLKLYRAVVFDGADPATAEKAAQKAADAITQR